MSAVNGPQQLGALALGGVAIGVVVMLVGVADGALGLIVMGGFVVVIGMTILLGLRQNARRRTGGGEDT